MRITDTDAYLHTLSCTQLQRMIQNGVEVEKCKQEWSRRWGLPYPYYKTCKSIEKVDE